MSWLWGSSKSDKDATTNLDPSLQDFLQKETARSQAATKTTQQPVDREPTKGPASDYRASYGLDKPGLTPQDKPLEQPRPLPSQSQFSDGRYADLWKTYRSQEEIAAATYTDQDMLSAVVENYKDRKAAIGRAALENCAMEQLAQHTCFISGSWAQLSNMCNAESRAFNRCYGMQSKFLKALGYLSVPSSPEEEERIQMHADKLYQEMLRREKVTEEAKAQGRTPETAPPLLQADEIERVLGKDSAFVRMRQAAIAHQDGSPVQMMKPDEQVKLRERMKDMTPEEKELELQLVAANLRVSRDLVLQMKDVREEEVKQRRLRRDEGRLTLGDRLKDLSGWTK